MYPKRPRFFAYRFCRLMAKVCLANEIGPEGCWLLTVIAQTEDAGGYRKPVTFWNGQLLSLVGVGSESALKRLRSRCVESGWLMYLPGKKGKAPSYWVDIPSKFAGVDDSPTDERPEKYVTSIESISDPQSGQKADGIRTESGLESGQKADGIRPTFIPDTFPDPNPDPKSSAAHSKETPKGTSAKQPSAKPETPAKSTTPKPTRPRDDLFDAVAKVTASDPRTSGSHIGRVCKALRDSDPPYTPEEIYQWAEMVTTASWWKGGRPGLGMMEKYIGWVRDKNPPGPGNNGAHMFDSLKRFLEK